MLMHPLTEINTSVEVGAVTRVYKSGTALRVAPLPLHIVVFDNNLNPLGAKALQVCRPHVQRRPIDVRMRNAQLIASGEEASE
jgi:hypothetical protein